MLFLLDGNITFPSMASLIHFNKEDILRPICNVIPNIWLHFS